MAEIRFIDSFCLGHLALFQQKRAKRVSRRMHPGPRLGIGKPVYRGDSAAQSVQTCPDITGMIGHLAPHHRRANRQNVFGIVVEIGIAVWQRGTGRLKGLGGACRLGVMSQCRQRHGA